MLELVVPNISHKEQWEEIMAEWKDDWRKNPKIFFQDSYEVFMEICSHVIMSDDLVRKIPKSSLYFLLNSETQRIVGLFTFRHNLNFWDDATHGGNIGYGIRPSERKRGFAKDGLRLLLIEVKKLGFENVFISCDDDNTGSYRVIEANGGVLEKYCERHGFKTRRYMIHIPN
ncbi:GNAT family N-acetyltransferase [Candidatus Gracilibacteria bacterium]|nr:GNAT family N-acetyltransferase [Candidatus Gracilibacteria bacterium]